MFKTLGPLGIEFVDKGIEANLLCPITRQPLSLMDESEIREVNAAIVGSLLRHANADARPLAGGAFGTPDRKVIYRIEDDIACFLPELAVAANHDRKARDRESTGVQRFYDEYGWIKSQAGSSTTRPISAICARSPLITAAPATAASPARCAADAICSMPPQVPFHTRNTSNSRRIRIFASASISPS